MVSIKDVAKRANVSISAVSKTLNGYSDVSESTRQKVMKAAQELNYFPNMLAKNLKHKVTKTIALIISNFEQANGKDGVMFQIMSGFTRPPSITSMKSSSTRGACPSSRTNPTGSFARKTKSPGWSFPACAPAILISKNW
ncbi:hypothetical protein HMSSN036_89230 [Paenibacillus macerans]|nr:hypothetical protein HMSSN036_89230 [Paenibacillus macerans]